jgi:hypothetical protein
LKRNLIGIHQPESLKSKIAQGARGGPNIERIAGTYKDNHQTA